MPPDAPAATGVAFPAAGGRRSSTATARAVVAAAVAEADPGLAATVERSADWRRGYVEAFARLTATTAADPAAAVAVARRGLAAAHEQVVLAEDEDVPLHQALSADRLAAAAPPATVTIEGAGEVPAGLELPLRGDRLRDEALVARLGGWEAAGVVEPSVTEVVRALAADPARLDLRGTTVLLLGAGAELGPYLRLARWGAHVVAVDLPRPALWQRLIAGVRPTAGRLSMPVRRPLPAGADDDRVAGAAGLDLLTELPAVAAWLDGHAAAAPGPVWLGTHVYADGAAHVLATLAADAVAMHLARSRPVDLGLLATPTDAFVVPEAAVEHSRARLRGGAAPARVLQRAVRAGSGGRLFAPNYRGLLDGGRAADGSPRLVGLHDALVPQQGAGYALAKRLQRWRATAWQADGQRVSVNVAPATRTRSVLRNRVLAAAYAGAHRFGVEVFDPPTSATLMAALLVADLSGSATGTAAAASTTGHPDEALWHGAVHGGLWRTPWAPRSVLGLAVGLGALPRGR